MIIAEPQTDASAWHSLSKLTTALVWDYGQSLPVARASRFQNSLRALESTCKPHRSGRVAVM